MYDAAGASAILAGDFNGDAKLDLATAGSVLLGNGTGTFQTAIPFTAGTAPSSLVAYDFDGDTKLDLGVANTNSDDVSVLLGNGDGTFQPAVGYATGLRPAAIAFGDFNGDGKIDLATANGPGATNVSVMLGNGNGTFQTHGDTAVGSVPLNCLATGDFDGDGKLDLAACEANTVPSRIAMLLGNGAGTFPTVLHSTTASNGQYVPQNAAAADLDGDGKLDLVVAQDEVVLLLGSGNGTFQAATALMVNAVDIEVTDLNGDGKRDVVTVSAGAVGVALGTGQGTFEASVGLGTTQTNNTTNSLAVGDFDGDGKPDIATGNRFSPSVGVFLRSGCE